MKAGNACEDVGNGNEGHGKGEVFLLIKMWMHDEELINNACRVRK